MMKLILTILFCLCVVSVPAWSAFAYKRSITIDYTKAGSSDSAYFPVLVSLSDSTLSHASGHVASANGWDIYFYSDSSLTTRLPAERETYTDAAGVGTYVGWVQVPNVSHSTNTVIYIAYGDSGISSDPNSDGTYGATSVWDSSYKGVWHLPNGTTLGDGTYTYDSTSNANTGTLSGTTKPSATTGKVDGGADFVSNQYQYIDSGDTTSLRLTHTGSVSVWEKTSFVRDQVLTDKSDWYGTNRSGYGLVVGENGSTSFLMGNTTGYDYVNGGSGLIDGNWHLVTATWDGSYINLYIDGVSVHTPLSQDLDAISNGYTLKLGKFSSDPSYTYNFNGSLDEVRISSTARSADWIKTEYNNQNSPSTFYTVGSETATATATAPSVTTGTITSAPGTTSAVIATNTNHVTASNGANITASGTGISTANISPITSGRTTAGGGCTDPCTIDWGETLAASAGVINYYQVYGTNSAGTGVGSIGSFYTQPAAQASTVTFSSVLATSMTVSVSVGSGDGRLVIMRDGTAPGAPTWGTLYTGNATWTSGDAVGSGYAICRGSSCANTPVTGLTIGHTYYVAVYEYAGTVATSGTDYGINYKASPATGTQATASNATYHKTLPTTGAGRKGGPGDQSNQPPRKR